MAANLLRRNLFFGVIGNKRKNLWSCIHEPVPWLWGTSRAHAPMSVGSRSIITSTAGEATTNKVPSSAETVICGGGIIGVSVAMHLAQKGMKNIVILEQGSLTCGSTWHAAGMVGRLKGTPLESEIVCYSRDLYKKLEAEGRRTGWKECGSIYLCQVHDRVVAYKRALVSSERLGVDGEFLTPAQCHERAPLISTEGLEGGFWIPGDGVVNPIDVTMAMAKCAIELDVNICQDVKVERVVSDGVKVTGVVTNQGTITCKTFVNCAGQWARELGQLSDVPVRVPLHSCEHFYLVTKPFDDVDPNMPVIRDYDGYISLRHFNGGILAGGFEPVAKPVFHNGIPENFKFQLLPEDWDHFHVLLEQMLTRAPALRTAEVQMLTNGPESFTPDGNMILGQAPELDNYFVAAGMNSMGVQAAGGVGKLMAEWIVDGEPSRNCWSLDIRRFVNLHNNKKFLRDRVKEIAGMQIEIKPRDSALKGFYVRSRKLRTSPIFTRIEKNAVFGVAMGYERPLFFQRGSSIEDTDWDRDWWKVDKTLEAINTDASLHTSTKPVVSVDSCRPLRTSTLYPKESEAGAEFGVFMGYERALHFQHPSSSHDMFEDCDIEPPSSFGKPAWFDKVKSEYWACREGVCLIDMSTFTKYTLRSHGTEVVDFLQYVCSNDIDQPVGSIVHTGMLNHSGGYENDCSVVRLAQNKYFLIGPTAQQTRSKKWIKSHLPSDGSVQLSDVTSMYTAINVMGPRARELLEELTDTKLDRASFPYMSCKEIDLGQASGVMAMRLTHTGEDGWILYIRSEYALHVYDSLMLEGKNYGIHNAGYYALRALRMEKFMAYWGTDLTPLTNPLECGRDIRVKFDKGGFIGHEALVRQRKEGIKKKLVQLLLEDHDIEMDSWPWGGEPIYRNGQFCGVTTSTAYGYTLDRHVCLGYVANIDQSTGDRKVVTNDFILKNAKFEVNIAGRLFPAKANIYSPKLASAAISISSRKK